MIHFEIPCCESGPNQGLRPFFIERDQKDGRPLSIRGRFYYLLLPVICPPYRAIIFYLARSARCSVGLLHSLRKFLHFFAGLVGAQSPCKPLGRYPSYGRLIAHTNRLDPVFTGKRKER